MKASIHFLMDGYTWQVLPSLVLQYVPPFDPLSPERLEITMGWLCWAALVRFTL